MSDPFRKTWKDYAMLTNRERAGLVVLFCILFIELGFLFYRHFLNPLDNQTASTEIILSPPLTAGGTSSASFLSPPSQPKQYRQQKQYPAKKEILIDVATADSAELTKLPLIGPVKARIIRDYRAKLGGFCSINQLREVWGIDDSIFQIIRPHVILSDSTHYQKMNINTSDAYTLNHHPYFYKNKNVSNVIVNYRKQHGNYQTVEDIKRTALVSDSLFLKIAPYLTVE